MNRGTEWLIVILIFAVFLLTVLLIPVDREGKREFNEQVEYTDSCAYNGTWDC